MTPSVREQLKALNAECETFCRGYSGDPKWVPFGEPNKNRHPNFLLAFSSVETFEQPGGVMIIGTNPGGDHSRARIYKASDPFERPGWSSYLDDKWNGRPGQHNTQLAVQRVAEIVSGSRQRVEPLLRNSPTGNLIPFRSERVNTLTPEPKAFGRNIGYRLIDIAKPRVLILIASSQPEWKRLMRRLENPLHCEWDLDEGKSQSANFRFREAQKDRDWPRFVFALPGLNQKNWGRNDEVLNFFEQRVKHYGRSSLLGRAGIGTWR